MAEARSPIVEQLDCLLNPKSVAVIGASNNPAKWGFGVFHDLISKGFAGEVYPVSRSEDIVSGMAAYKNINDIPGGVDLAAIVVPAQYVAEAMKDCVCKGVRSAVVITAGFGELSDEGAKLEEEALRIARQGGIRFVGPNCFGIVNTASNFSSMGFLSPLATGSIPRGPVGIISQSGNAGSYVLGMGTLEGLGFSKFISSGNEADLHFEDYLEYLSWDPETKVIVGYVEGIRDGQRFLRVAKETSPRKPIVLLKVGGTEVGAKAAKSHTGALSGSANIYEAAFKQAGVICVGEVEELIDVATALAHQPVPKGNRVAIVSIGGGFGVIAADTAARLGLEVPPLSPETIQRLSKWLPPFWSHSNPVDMVVTVQYSYACIGAVLKDENIDAALAISSIGFPAMPSLDGLPSEWKDQAEGYVQQMKELEVSQGVSGLLERIEKYGKPVIAGGGMTGSMTGRMSAGTGIEEGEAIERLRAKGVVVFSSPERAARVLAYLVRYGEYLRSLSNE